MPSGAVMLVPVLSGWFIFAASLVPILMRGRRATVRRAPKSVAAMLLQGVAFGLAWGGVRGVAEAADDVQGSYRIVATLAGALSIFSALFAVAAVRHLGKQWSLVARVADDHELITTGPYALVRHPIYTAMLGLLIATALVFSSLPATLTAIVLYVSGTLMRTRAEERLLEETFGERYRIYQSRVPALVPRLTRTT